MASMQIHEFSTGIRPERTPDGDWVSCGFTGQYMNATLDPIPHAVQRSIANKEFAVAEGTAKDTPALVGRIVSGSEQPDWSVIAVVTRGRDEKGRSLSLYRYFLAKGAEGADTLGAILAWLAQGNYPQFDPFAENVQPSQSSLTPLLVPPPQAQAVLSRASGVMPMILPLPSQNVQLVHQLAIENARHNQLPVTWAFNVEALEQPGRFQVIQPASERAYQLLKKARTVQPISAATTHTDIDEQALIAAINGLMSNTSTVKAEHIQEIGVTLSQPAATADFWKAIFDGRGATNALKQRIYSAQMVRLLTLRAIVLPESLPEYLRWLKLNNRSDSKNPNSPANLSWVFQTQLQPFLTELTASEHKFLEGMKQVLSEFLQEQVTLEAVLWLLDPPGGLWSHYTRSLTQQIKADLQQFEQVYLSNPKRDNRSEERLHCPEIWHKTRFWSDRTYRLQPEPYYSSFVELFTQLKEFKLAAYFQRVSEGKVTKEIYLSAFDTNSYEKTLWGLRLIRKKTLAEKLIAGLAANLLPLVILGLLAAAVGGVFVFFPDLLNRIRSDNPDPIPPERSPTSAPSSPTSTGTTPAPAASTPDERNPGVNLSPKPAPATQSTLPPSTPAQVEKAFASYPENIDQIVSALVAERLPEEQIYEQLITILSANNQFQLSRQDLEAANPNQKAQWIEAVKNYQSTRNLSTDGALGAKTNESLKCDVLRNLGSATLQPQCDSSAPEESTPTSTPPESVN